MENKIWKQAEEKDVQNFIETLRGYSSLRQNNLLIYVSYLLYLRNKYAEGNQISLDQLLGKSFSAHDADLTYVLRDFVSQELWDDVQRRVTSVANHVLETVILDTSGVYFQSLDRSAAEYNTPETLADLAINLLEIKPDEKVCDICGGIGNFTIKAFLKHLQASYYSKDINVNAASIMEIRKDILKSYYDDISIYTEIGNALDGDSTQVFDKIFGNYPWMLDMRGLYPESNPFLKKLKEEIPGICSPNASDWLFNFLMLHRMKESGKAIGIMTNGSTWNQISSCRAARKYFLENGLIEAVIALPEKMFGFTAISSTMIVFSHGNKKVKMIDATQLCTEKMRQNVITKENMESILSAYREDGEHSISVSVKDILEKNDTVLHPSRYLAKAMPVKDGQPLKEVLKDIYRGAPINAKELDTLLTDTPSEYQYVMMKQINDGVIDADLPYLSISDTKYEKFIAQQHSIILSKMGPFKCAVVEASPERKLIINGNMFILQADETKVNPYYLKALFESAYGAALLSSICTGTVIHTFTKKALEDLVIPVPSMEKQNKIAKEYLSLQDEIQIYRRKIARAMNKKSHIFDELQEG